MTTQTPGGAGDNADERKAELEERAAKGDRDAVRELRHTRVEELAPMFYGDRNPTSGKPREES